MFAILYILSIKYIVILVTTVGSFYVVKKPKVAFYILLFTFPFKNFYIWAGTDIQVWKLLSAAFLIVNMPRWLLGQNSSGKINKYVALLIVFFIYVILLTVINAYLLSGINIQQMAGGFFKNEGRIFFQLTFFVITLNLVLIPMQTLRTITDILMALKVLLYALIVLAILGLVQYVILHITGVDLFPVHAIDNVIRSNFVLGMNDSVFRVNSLAGEPKHMAIAMVMGITIILLSRMNKTKIVRYDLWVLVLFSFNLFFTYSTTGYALIVITLALLIFIQGILHWRSVLLLCSLSLVSFIMIGNLSETSKYAFEKQAARISFEIQDETIKSYFYDQPAHAIIGTGLGNIHHYSVKYFPSDFPLFRGTPYKANSGILFMLADFGLIGIFLLYSAFFLSLRKNLTLLKSVRILQYNEMKVVIYFAIIFSILYLARYNELFFILLGIMLSLNFILKNLKIKQLELRGADEIRLINSE